MPRQDYILTLSCPDRTGIVFHVSGLLYEHGCNILDSQQFGDPETGRFFLRMHVDLPTEASLTPLADGMTALAATHQMQWALNDARHKPRLLLMVSRQGHCLNDLLYRVHSGLLSAEVVGVVSNHQDMAAMTRSYGVPFHYLPVTPESKAEQERAVLDLIDRAGIDLVVLARYMQILSPAMCQALQGRAINIHHSFLPSFKGARPYHQAHARGVKLIGATAHYVTSDLDEGPIIEQDIERVDHSLTAQDLTQVGSDIESRVLARGVRRHIEHRILLNGKRTVVFS